MSSFGGFSSFQIHSDAENANQIARKTKREDLHGKPPANKRAALGQISNNTRVQPVRAAKQGLSVTNENVGVCGQDENVAPKVHQTKSIFGGLQSSQGFSIHVDDEQQMQTSEPRISSVLKDSHLTLHSGITSVNPYAFEESPTSADSPMLLDTSVESQRTEFTAEQRLQRILCNDEYAEEIYNYIRDAELKYRPKPGYMKKQPDITNSMRSILIDWLVEVAEEYKLHRETLFLSISYIDRFLSQMSVLRGKLQLVGAASMFLAAKYEEIYPPDVKEFVYITDDTYDVKQVLKMEHLILKVLNFDVAVPTINLFCEKFLKEMGYTDSDPEFNLAMMLIELTLVESEVFLHYTPSMVAAAAVCLSNHTVGKEPWPAHMVDVTGYSIEDFSSCLNNLHKTFAKAPSHPQQAIREKYKQDKFAAVARLSPSPLFSLNV